MKYIIRKSLLGVMAVCMILGISACGSNEYSIIKDKSEHGSYTTVVKGKEVSAAKEGDVVSIMVVPEDGFIFNSINVKSDGKELTTFKSGEEKYSFTMSAADATIAVVFGYKPTVYGPGSTVLSQEGFSSASLSTYADNTFDYTYVSSISNYGATETKTSYYTGTWEMDGSTIILNVDTENYTYAYTHPRTEAALAAYEQFCEEYATEITDKLDSANTAYIDINDSDEVLKFKLDESNMSFELVNE